MTGTMRWWGWGVDGHDPELSPRLQELLDRELGPGTGEPPAVPREPVLPDRPLPAAVREHLAAAVGAQHVRDDHRTRLLHAAGRSYPDLVRLRAGAAVTAPDAVVFPATHEQVAAVLRLCADLGVAVVPFGGGTSVVGGVEALRGPFDAVIAVDLSRLDQVLAVDRESLTATVEAGIRGPALEAALNRSGVTLGHFPQSFEFSTVGGWVATRSAGQASTGVGRIDELVLGLRCATPAGDLEARAVPATAAGPDLRELLVGSEGTLGIITEVTLRVRPVPQARRYEAWSVRSFRAGLEALRLLEQHDAAPDIARLSDEDETRLSLALAGDGRGARLFERYLGLRGHAGGCLVIAGYEGDAAHVRRRRRESARLLRRAGAVALGTPIGRAWHRGRFHGPYLRDVLLGHRVLVDTLETATTWSQLPVLHAAVRAAISTTLGERGRPAFVACHVSHLYRAGASLYFTFAARQEPGAELEQWHAAKQAASDAIVAAGATITHHHGVGRDHAPWLVPEVGPLGLELLRSAKLAVDPVGIMNPGKLIDPAPLPGAPEWNVASR